MKLFLTAIALAVASPAVAQTAPADPHSGHAQAAQTTPAADRACTPEHAAMGHCTRKKAAAAPAADPHAGYANMPCCDNAADGKKACCEKMKAEGKKMECCAETGAKSKAHAGHSAH
jgi:hypothetical protein